MANRALELDGTGGYVELPPNIFNRLDEATVEAWVRFDDLGGQEKRVFNYGDARNDLSLMTGYYADNTALALVVAPDLHFVRVDGLLRPKQWLHLAGVTGRGGMKLYLNGALAGTNDFPGSFSGFATGTRNYLGQTVTTNDAPVKFKGAIDEVRVWRVARTAEQIQQSMFQRLTGREEGLAALWNFDDVTNGVVRDSGPGAHHGKLVGQASIVEPTQPWATAPPPWSRLLVQVMDANGLPLPNVALRAQVNGVEVGSATSGSQALTPLTVWTTAPAVDLVASGSNEVGGWRLSVPITPYAERTTVWRPGRVTNIGGRATALDGKTPHAGLVVELVRLNEQTLPAPGADQPRSFAATTNHVLNLSGDGGYATLPPNIFADLTEATVEGWTRWRGEPSPTDSYRPAINFGSSTNGMFVGRFNDGTLIAGLGFTQTKALDIRSDFPVGRNEWVHWALVSGPGGMELYVDGILAGTNAGTASFAAVTNSSQENLLGLYFDWRDSRFKNIQGQLDEIRVWRVRRTAEQIRSSASQRLTGDEPGLVGLWSFDDPTQPLRDRSPNGHHGRLDGPATITNAAVPVIVFGNITDATGKPVTNAAVEVYESGQPDRRFAANAAGEYAITPPPTARCDLFVTDGERSAYRLGFQSTDKSQRLDWVLTEGGVAVGQSQEAVNSQS
ncbi:MAG: LamG-like jellyroll fold domain-containing protein, partial [Verrucomicrobiota bacterium]